MTSLVDNIRSIVRDSNTSASDLAKQSLLWQMFAFVHGVGVTRLDGCGRLLMGINEHVCVRFVSVV